VNIILPAPAPRCKPGRSENIGIYTSLAAFPVCNIWKAKRFLGLSKRVGGREMKYGELGLGIGDWGTKSLEKRAGLRVAGARAGYSSEGMSEDHHDPSAAFGRNRRRSRQKKSGAKK
jgi:hypothetical protein